MPYDDHKRALSGWTAKARARAPRASSPVLFAIAAAFVALAGAGEVACSSDGDPYVESVRAELRTGTFACGDLRCAPSRHYCLISRRDVAAFGESSLEYACVPLPIQCAAMPRCDCLDAPSCVERGEGLVVEESPP
jgi:hypothetical protein